MLPNIHISSESSFPVPPLPSPSQRKIAFEEQEACLFTSDIGDENRSSLQSMSHVAFPVSLSNLIL